MRVDLATPGGDGEAGENDDLYPDVEQVIGGSGNDQLTGNSSANTLVGGGGEDRLRPAVTASTCWTAARSNDVLPVRASEDILIGGDGDDALDGGSASDSLDGGGGDDQAVYNTRREALTVTLDGEPYDGAQGENDRIKTNVEGVAAGAGADRLEHAGTERRVTYRAVAGRDNLDRGHSGPGRRRLRGGQRARLRVVHRVQPRYTRHRPRPRSGAGQLRVSLARVGSPDHGERGQDRQGQASRKVRFGSRSFSAGPAAPRQSG